MASQCKSCDNKILSSDFITCAGLCGEHFHIKCVAVTKPMLAAVSNCPNIHWYCHACNDGSRNISSVVNGINESIERLSSSLSNNLLQFLNDLQVLMDRIFKTIGTGNVIQNQTNTADSHDQNCQRENGSEERDKLDNCGYRETKEIDDGLIAKCANGSNIGTSNADPVVHPVKMVVVSNIGKSISVDYLANYLADELKIDKRKIRVSLLLPGGKTVDDMNFLQFKVTVPVDKYDLIMNSSTWPSNVRIRDFVNKPRINIGVSLQNFMEKRTVNC
ncbi:uncharacterized protein LOC119070531 [Bradysia coprophila]|uniref:uncharacterized protein LOC119070531 n=1 Tax=Bradysia coprophila TaxID=38358 RepID=UPI00187DD5A7|nr:uncharacterized protein LOC119070531 [Bradysia coprophila]